MTVNFYHEQRGGLSLPWKQFRINEVEKGFKRAPEKSENLARVRRPLTDVGGGQRDKENIGEWGIGGESGGWDSP